MFGGLRNAAAFEPATVAVESAWSHINGRVGNPILTKLRNGAVVAYVFEDDFHGLFALECHVSAGSHIGHGDCAAGPFVPVTIIILFKAGVCDEVAVEKRENRKGRGMNGVRA